MPQQEVEKRRFNRQILAYAQSHGILGPTATVDDADNFVVLQRVFDEWEHEAVRRQASAAKAKHDRDQGMVDHPGIYADDRSPQERRDSELRPRTLGEGAEYDGELLTNRQLVQRKASEELVQTLGELESSPLSALYLLCSKPEDYAQAAHLGAAVWGLVQVGAEIANASTAYRPPTTEMDNPATQGPMIAGADPGGRPPVSKPQDAPSSEATPTPGAAVAVAPAVEPAASSGPETSAAGHPGARSRSETDPIVLSHDSRDDLSSITDDELQELVDAIEHHATTDGPVKPSKLSRPPSLRLDLANAPLTPRQQAWLDEQLARLKADGTLPADFVYVPPSAPGFAISRDAAARAATLIGVILGEDAEIAKCWQQAVTTATRGQPLTAGNYEKLYEATQKVFWRKIADNAVTRKYFEDRGFVVKKGRAPYLAIPGLATQEIALGLDHTEPKAAGDNFQFALDPGKIEILFQADNTKLSHLEKKHPELRRGSASSGRSGSASAKQSPTATELGQ